MKILSQKMSLLNSSCASSSSIGRRGDSQTRRFVSSRSASSMRMVTGRSDSLFQRFGKRGGMSRRNRRYHVSVEAVSVDLVQEDGSTTVLDVPEGENILAVGLEQGLDIPYDCRTGVCMRCSAKLLSGEVDQSAGMLNEDVQKKGYVLLCCAIPQGEGVRVQVIDENELLNEVFES